MKKILNSLMAALAVMLLFLITTAQKNPPVRKFYYAFTEKMYLDEIPGKYVVRLKSDNAAAELKQSLTSRMQNQGSVQSLDPATIAIDVSGTTKTIGELLKPDMAGVLLVKPAYKYDRQEMYYTNEILVEPLEGVSIQKVIGNARLENTVTVAEGKFFSTLTVPQNVDACDIANRIQEGGLVKYSHPNFIIPIDRFQVIPNDTYFNNQFYLRNTGQVFNPVENHAGTPNADINASFAWNTTTGSNAIIVAVIDEGLTPNHTDLPNVRQVRLNGSNFVPGENANDPTPGLNNNHGNACSGIIAATQNNNEGVTGIAPNVRIMPIKIFGQNASANNAGLANAIDFAWQNGAHVISNSWGFTGATNPNLVPAIVAAITRAVTQGRTNRGCVVAFAASNSATHSTGGNGTISFPGSVQINGVLTVGASDRNDRQSDYSPTSNTASADNQIIDIVAPSHRAYPPAFGGIANEGFEVWTIDIPGLNGYNRWNDAVFPGVAPAFGEILPAAGVNNLSYTGRMGGTSAATPQVAAVAALLLSMNNNLTQQQVFDIITQSADKVGGVVYNANGWSAEMGNGRLNACAALSRLPGRYSVNGIDRLCTTSTYTVPGLPAGSTIQWSSSNTGIATINNSGLATRVSQGSVTLTATITIANRCGTATATKTINVGSPISIQATMQGCSSGFQSWVLSVTPTTNGSNWSWTVSSLGTNSQINIYNPNSPSTNISVKGGGTVRLTYTDACGTVRTDGVTVYSTCPPFRIIVSPNPVKNNMSVQFSEGESRLAIENTTTPVRKIESKGKTVVTLFEMNTSTISRQWSFKESATQNYNLNTNGLRRGVYVLQVDRDNETRVTKVIVE